MMTDHEKSSVFYEKVSTLRNKDIVKQSNLKENRKEFLEKLKHDNDLYLKIYYDLILEIIVKKCLKWADDEKKEFTLWNIKNLVSKHDDQKTNLKINTFWYGFYNSYNKKSDKSAWDELNIPLMLEQLNNKFNEFGICFTDISDRTKSFNQVIKVTIIPKNEK